MDKTLKDILKTIWEDGADVEFDCGRNTKEVMNTAEQAIEAYYKDKYDAVFRKYKEHKQENGELRASSTQMAGDLLFNTKLDYTQYKQKVKQVEILQQELTELKAKYETKGASR